MAPEAKWVNDSGNDMDWLMEWAGGGGQAGGDLEPGDPFQCTFKNGADMCGFELSDFTGQAVALLNDAGFASSLQASNATAEPGEVVEGTEVQWNNYCASQTVQWLTVTNSGQTASGPIPPNGQVTQVLAPGVAQVGFQLENFSGVMASAFGSATLTADLFTSDSE